MNWSLATDKQLWAIMKGDANCPFSLMEGVFQEATNRGMIRQYILAVIKKRFGSSEYAQKKLKMTHEDLIQVGYLGAINTMKYFKPGYGTFTNLLFLNISQSYGHQIQYLSVAKRQGEECSYNQMISEEGQNGNTLERYLIDNHTNVEKFVISKIQFEEKMNLLNKVQKETFLRFFDGFTYNEIAKQMGAKRNTVAMRMKKAIFIMTGKNINLKDLGVFERPSFKKQGA